MRAFDSRLAGIIASIDREETIDLARSLVRIPTISGREGLSISEFMADWLRDARVEPGLQHVGPERANVIGRLGGMRPGTRLLLNGHLDTKPADTMTIDPFSGDVVDGRLYGRGSCDMKGPVAAMMIAMKALAGIGTDLNGTLLFGSEVGEDGGGWRFDDLIDGPCACDVGICGEPTNLELHVGCRGFYPLKVRTIGRATHTGFAYSGINAIQKMCSVIPALYNLQCFHQVDPLWGRSPINAMIIAGGGKVSASVPDECDVRFDIRLNPNLSPVEVERIIEVELDRLMAGDPELKLIIEKPEMKPDQETGGTPASHLLPNHPVVESVARATARVTGARPVLAGFPGGCSTALMHMRGIPSVVIGPGNLLQAHTVDEWIDVDQIYEAAKIYASIAYEFLLS